MKGKNAKLGVKDRDDSNSSVLAGSLLSDLGNSTWVSVLDSTNTHQMFIPFSFNSYNKSAR